MGESTRPIKRRAALSWLWGARVQRVDGPAPGVFSLTLFNAGEKQTLVLAVSPTQRGVGSTLERPKGEAASAFVRRLRTKIENARLSEAHWLEGETEAQGVLALELSFRRGELTEQVIADFDPRAPNLLLLGQDQRVVGAADERAFRARAPDRKAPFEASLGRGIRASEDQAELFSAGQKLVGASATRVEDAVRTQARALAKTALKRVERRAEAIRGDLVKTERAPWMRREANALLCNLGAVPRGAQTVRLLDESVDPPTWLELALDPARDATQNAQLRFDRARKLDRGAGIARTRLAEAEHELERLRGFAALLEVAPPETIREQAEHLGFKLDLTPLRAQKRKAEPREHVAFRTFVGTGGRKLLVGKGAVDNDTLTLTIARPHDHWLHVRGVHGAHVVVPLDRNAAISQELLLDAAHLAAHFSDVRGEPSAEIQHTERRYVRKPKGAAPGAVNIDREKVFVLRVERDRLAQLLASERG